MTLRKALNLSAFRLAGARTGCAIALGALALAACGQPSVETPPTASPAPQEQAPPEASEAAGASCTGASLSLAVTAQDAGAGSRFATLAFTNTGAAVCTLEGYPEIALLGADGQPRSPFRIEQTPATTDVAPVTLPPGGQAWFDLVTTAVAGEVPGETEPCPAATAVRAVIGGAKVDAPIQLNPCNQRARVSTIRATAEPAPPQ